MVGQVGPSGDGSSSVEVSVLSTTVILTNEQFRLLPTTPVVIIPATETLNYSTAPSQLPMPITGFITIEKSAGGYSNDDTNAALVLAWGSDWSVSASLFATIAGSPIESTTPAMALFSSPRLLEQVALSNELGPVPLGGLDTSFQDNALVIAAQNGLGNWTGGNVANVIRVTVLYTIVAI